MALITFQAKPYEIDSWLILRLPKDASSKLPSRGQVMVEGSINGYELKTPLEPDGDWGHWFNVDNNLQEAAKVAAGATAQVIIKPTKDWPEPELPADLKQSLAADSQACVTWDRATPMAHWEWVRWIRSTNNNETRNHRAEVTMSKLRKGERRPCCWNRNLCTEPAVSKSGVLLEPA